MVFSSTEFLFLFLPLTLGVYLLLNNRLRNAWLLVMSLVFYAWGEPRFVLVMVASIVINYAAGRGMGEVGEPRLRRKLVLAAAVAMNLGLLFWFKYFNLFAQSANTLLGALGKPGFVFSEVVLPIGISFFTFQGLSYVIDVYRGSVKPQKNFITLAIYKALFPQLIAGPIVRYHDIAAQLDVRPMELSRFGEGVRRFSLGLGKKVLIANTLGTVADKIFSQPIAGVDTPVAWIGIIAYTLQIYFDFSGYSDMAIGLAKMFGFDFLENFNYPYISKSITEFWRRWHISLSTWFRDYLYIPLGGNRKGTFNTYRNLIIVFAITGFWHGASWTFLLWGLWHGLFLVIERVTKWTERPTIPAFVKHGYALLVVMIGWVYFRADNLGYASSYLATLFGLGGEKPLLVYDWAFFLDAKVCGTLIVACMAATPVFRRLFWNAALPLWFRVLRGAAYVLVLCWSVVVFMSSSYNPFLYFKF